MSSESSGSDAVAPTGRRLGSTAGFGPDLDLGRGWTGGVTDLRPGHLSGFYSTKTKRRCPGLSGLAVDARKRSR